MKKILIILLVSCVAYEAYAQQVRTAKGSILYVIPKNLTLEQAEVLAVQEAKAKIIADNFGTAISSTTTMTMLNENGKSQTKSFTFGETEVKGEWIETISGPHIERKVLNGEFVIEVTIVGKVREIISAPVIFNAKVLRNGVTDNCESDSFKNRDLMYISFTTPEAGYLSIYITDGKDVQSLYPYRGLSSEHMQVKADKKYIFFSKEHSGNIDPNLVDKCWIGCKEDNEHNRIYLIFSPNKYSKAVDYSASDSRMPRYLSFEEFHNWLSKLRRFDDELICKPFDIIINK